MSNCKTFAIGVTPSTAKGFWEPKIGVTCANLIHAAPAVCEFFTSASSVVLARMVTCSHIVSAFVKTSSTVLLALFASNPHEAPARTSWRQRRPRQNCRMKQMQIPSHARSHSWVSRPDSSPIQAYCRWHPNSNTCSNPSLKVCPDEKSCDSWNLFQLSTTILVSQDAVVVDRHALGSYTWNTSQNCQQKQMQSPPHAQSHSWISRPGSFSMSSVSAYLFFPKPPCSNTCIPPSLKVCPHGNSLAARYPFQLSTTLLVPRDAGAVGQHALDWYILTSMTIQRKQLKLKKPWQAKKTESTPNQYLNITEKVLSVIDNVLRIIISLMSDVTHTRDRGTDSPTPHN